MKKLLIIFFIVLGIYFYRLSTGNSAMVPYTAINTNARVNSLIIDQNNPSIYGIPINEPTELDFLSKQKVLDIRKGYAAMNPAFIPANYTPSDAVFGQIEDYKPWWGLSGRLFKGPGQSSIEGLSEETRSINNPLLMFIVDLNFWIVDLNLKGAEIYPKPVLINFQPSKKSICVVYDVTNFNKTMNDYLINNANLVFDDNSSNFTLIGLNARDFGYNYAYAYSTQNVKFDNISDNISTNVQLIENFLHTGGSCGYQGGCNNNSPEQPFLNFKNFELPAQISIKLWKKMPADIKTQADLYYIITLQ